MDKYMRFNKILVTGFSHENLDESVWDQVKILSNEIVFEPASDVDCLLARFNKVDKAVIDQFPQLKYIGILATGYGTVDTQYAQSKNIVVCNIPGYCTQSVGEYVFALILEHLRQLEKAKQVAHAGDFSGDGFSATEISGKQFGVIGLGHIGQKVAEIAAFGFGAKVSYWSRSRKQDVENKSIVYTELDSLISNSDFLTLHLNKAPETIGILTKTRINSIKSGAILINVSPMELIDLDALEARLQKGNLTFIFDHPDEMEKKDVDRLVQHPNCVVYPPIGFITKEARVQKQVIFVSNLEHFLNDSPINQVS